MSQFNQRSRILLDEIGIGPLWVRRAAISEVEYVELPAVAVEVNPAVVTDTVDTADTTPAPATVIPVAVNKPPMVKPNLPSAWDDEPSPQPLPKVRAPIDALKAVETISMVSKATPGVSGVATMDWSQLKSTVSACTACGLCHKRKNTVFGVGDEKAKWLFIGEGPGRNEDAQGEPFVGAAGKLLDNMLKALGLQRGDNAYIANIVKCRPTDGSGKDRPPSLEEAAACMPYLQRQIALIQPHVIVALGKTAALSLLQRDPETPVSSLRGTIHRYADLPLIVTYHPAYLLRNPVDKRKTWADLCLAMKMYGDASSIA